MGKGPTVRVQFSVLLDPETFTKLKGMKDETGKTYKEILSDMINATIKPEANPAGTEAKKTA